MAPDPNACLRRHLGRQDVEVVREGEISHFDRLPVSVPTTATLDWVRSAVPGVPVDERRFRPNLLVRTPPGAPPFVEDEWSGSKARIGDAVCVEFVRSSERCVTTDEAQKDLPHSPLVCGPSQKPMPCGWTGSPRSCRRDRYGRETPSPRSEKSSPG
ncbi:MOSC domain-containing protein [Streptomyces albus]|uniref:MOSC domain-containing protein n=1 Tax=Streptomyces sp. NRRL F-5639 TaxID=1463867 RepID=UPI000A3F3B8F|nr:MOSC domain-containing protein [Streptomyces sp. NRRL F-5639]